MRVRPRKRGTWRSISASRVRGSAHAGGIKTRIPEWRWPMASSTPTRRPPRTPIARSSNSKGMSDYGIKQPRRLFFKVGEEVGITFSEVAEP